MDGFPFEISHPHLHHKRQTNAFEQVRTSGASCFPTHPTQRLPRALKSATHTGRRGQRQLSGNYALGLGGYSFSIFFTAFARFF